MNCQELVEKAGAVFIGYGDGCVYFRDRNDSKTLSIYKSALRSPEDIVFAVKSHREQVRANLNIWELAGSVETVETPSLGRG